MAAGKLTDYNISSTLMMIRTDVDDYVDDDDDDDAGGISWT